MQPLLWGSHALPPECTIRVSCLMRGACEGARALRPQQIDTFQTYKRPNALENSERGFGDVGEARRCATRETSMQAPKIPSGIIVVLAATVCLTPQPSIGASDQCHAAPSSSTPPGSHWYYRIDRANNQRCWYLDAAGLQVRSHAIEAASHPVSSHPAAEAALPQAASARPALARQAADAATATPEVSIPEQRTSEFAARWPDLPMSLNLAALKVAELSSSYAETPVAADVEPQMPSQWPILEAEPAKPRVQLAHKTSSGPPLLTIALGIASLLFAGWGIRLGASAYRSA